MIINISRIIALFLISSIRSTHCDIGEKNLSLAPENRDFLVGCHREEKTKPRGKLNSRRGKSTREWDSMNF